MFTPRRLLATAILVALAPVLVAGCGGSSTTASPATTAPVETLSIFATPRPQFVLEALGRAFESEHPGVAVKYTFGLTDDLAGRLQRGEKADLVIEGPNELAAMAARPLAGTQQIPLGADRLQVVVPKGNPKGLKDPPTIFGNPALRTGVCDPDGYWLCGRAAQELAATARYTSTSKTVETDPKKLVDKVAAGELDAALMFRSDVGPRTGDVTLVDVDPNLSGPIQYDVVRLRSSTPAVQFVQFVQESPSATALLTQSGLLPLINGSGTGG